MMIDYTEVGQRIARIRKAKGLTQFQVCESCNLSDKYLSNIERARSIPSIDVVMSICKVLDTTPNTILLGTSTCNDADVLSEVFETLKILDNNQLEFTKIFIKWISEQVI